MGIHESSSRDSSRRREWSSCHRRQRYDDIDDDGGQMVRKQQTKRKISEEERIKEYFAKKAQKTAKRLKSQTQTLLGEYSNDSNPFGDSNLNKKFVWLKKIERDVAQGRVPINAIFSVKAEKKRQRERMAEIEKVKKRREERAIEKSQHEEKLVLLARERARAEFQGWEKKEDEFLFHQSKVGSEIRLGEGRMKPIDILSKSLDRRPSDDFDMQINEPSYMTVFTGLTVKEMEELHKDVKMHLDMDRATPTLIQYWESLLVVCEWELAEARKTNSGNVLDRAGERGLPSNIEADVKVVLAGKNYAELEVLQAQIECDMRSGKAKVVEFWEAVLKRLPLFKAKACLKEIHAQITLQHKHDLRHDLDHQQQGIDHDEKDAPAFNPEPLMFDDHGETDQDQAKEVAGPGSYSPQLLPDDLDDEEAIDPEEDSFVLEKKRIAVLEAQQRKQETDETNLAKIALKAMGVMEEGDAAFGSNDEVHLVDAEVSCEKYRPRKPKYFNRVHTGYVWNKYNQTHYDHDNPPPKFVQGYKFNIFYPDLVDKSKVPSYSIEKDGESVETCIIRFHAGPPYECIAFRIVNNEWEYSRKNGYKCTFERGILQLYFNFKHTRYRR